MNPAHAAVAFERLLNHLRQRPEVQNIDLMILADFCRNCLAEWYREAADAAGETISRDQAREVIYGMPYEQWKREHQRPATPEQQAAFQARNAPAKPPQA